MFAIVPAAGDSVRMTALTAGQSKLLLDGPTGLPLIAHTIGNLLDAHVFRGVVVASRAADIPVMDELLRPFQEQTEIILVEGGATRQESVFFALQVLHEKASYVLVHDGARPACPTSCIQQVAEVTRATGAAVLAVPVTSTLKRVERDRILETVPREELWAAQTPQGFAFDILLAAHEAALRDSFVGTDDSQLVERLPYPVTIVRGTEANIKVTTPSDYSYARSLIAARG